MIAPPYLRQGDKIGIVACARKVSREDVGPALDIIRAHGLEPVLSPNLFCSDHQFSGTDQQRAADLQQMFDDPAIAAVISARGGYGTLRIIDNIDFKRFRARPKWVTGYSDITVLHSHIHKLGIETLHATMPINFTKNSEATTSLFEALRGELKEHTFPAHPLNRNGEAEGELVGGNLSLLYALQSSPTDIDTKGKILFLEDLDEYLYHFDRMMISLKRAGKLQNLAGLVIGGMTEMKDNLIPFGKQAEEIIADIMHGSDIPVAFNFPAGHIDRNMAVYLGRSVKFSVQKDQSTILYK